MYQNSFRPLIIFGVVAAIIYFNSFYELGVFDLIFSGDQFFPFSLYEAERNFFYLRKQADLGVLNGWQFTTQFWDGLFYIIVYRLGIDRYVAQHLLFILLILVSFLVAFNGFKTIGARMFGITTMLPIYLATIWYCCAPYVVQLLHGGVYNLGASFTYSLAPLILYNLHITLFKETDFSQIFLTAVLMAIASFTFWLFAPLAFFLTIFIFLQLILSRGSVKLVLKNSVLLLGAYLPLISCILFAIGYEYLNNTPDMNSNFTPTYGNMQGGIWYQLLMYHSWGIYTVWWPRALYPFGDYYFSLVYFSGVIGFYILLTLGLLRVAFTLVIRRRFKLLPDWLLHLLCIEGGSNTDYRKSFTSVIVPLLISFAVVVFLAKGAQPPLGYIFEYLYESFGIFRVFRTPDIRFGFPIALSLAILLLYISISFKRSTIAVAIPTCILVLSFHLFDGTALRGKNISDKYVDRIYTVSRDEEELSNFLRNQKSYNQYVLPLPPIEYGLFTNSKADILSGQDPISKLVRHPFIYLSSTGGLAKNTHGQLSNIIEHADYSALQKFPIQYILLRKDICSHCTPPNLDKLGAFTRPVFSNSTYKLLELHNSQPLISSTAAEFRRVNPVKYQILINSLSAETPLLFNQNFSNGWRLYVDDSPWKHRLPSLDVGSRVVNDETHLANELFSFSDVSFLWRKYYFGSSHEEALGYANGWTISPQEIRANFGPEEYTVNADGSINILLTLYFMPQAGYLLAWMVSLSLFLFFVIRVLFSSLKRMA
jgi:hypothetical protein